MLLPVVHENHTWFKNILRFRGRLSFANFTVLSFFLILCFLITYRFSFYHWRATHPKSQTMTIYGLINWDHMTLITYLNVTQYGWNISTHGVKTFWGFGAGFFNFSWGTVVISLNKINFGSTWCLPSNIFMGVVWRVWRLIVDTNHYP